MRYLPMAKVHDGLTYRTSSVTRMGRDLLAQRDDPDMAKWTENETERIVRGLLEDFRKNLGMEPPRDHLHVEVEATDSRNFDFSFQYVRVEVRAKWNPYQCNTVRLIGGPAHGHVLEVRDHRPITWATPDVSWRTYGNGHPESEEARAIQAVAVNYTVYELGGWDTVEDMWVMTVGGRPDDLDTENTSVEAVPVCGWPGCGREVRAAADTLTGWEHGGVDARALTMNHPATPPR